MKAMVLDSIQSMEETPNPLNLRDAPVPLLENDDLLIKISACGVCHTELDEIEGRTPPSALPRVLGHQIVGRIVDRGKNAISHPAGARVGVAWIYNTCGRCRFCKSGEENLCPRFQATGRDADGGYAEYVKVSEAFVYLIPESFTDSEAAPLLCAGAIGYRSLKLANLKNGQNLGLTGFGASAHLVLQMVRHRYPDSKVFVFTRKETEGDFGLLLGAVWSGSIRERSPILLDRIIDTTPAWLPVREALRNLSPGGRLVINAIRKEEKDKSELLQLEYPEHLWMEKEIKTVANVSRDDVAEFLKLAAEIGLKPEYQEFPLEDANRALQELRSGQIRGAKVLRIN